jgi:hypothetical protein
MNLLLLMGHVALFSGIFFAMFCRVNKTDAESASVEVRWSLVGVLTACVIEIFAPFFWPNYVQDVHYLFGVSVLVLQMAMSHLWKYNPT